MADTEIHGQELGFGFIAATDAPTISNFVAFKRNLQYAPEVMAKAQNGEGHTIARAMSKKTHRAITGTFTGYITAGWSANAMNNTFNYTVNEVSRLFFITGISDPRNKGEFTEVDITVESDPMISPS